jgi:hypothetical protein
MTARYVLVCCLAFVWTGGVASAQSRLPAQAPSVSRNPLSEEQKAVYRAALAESTSDKAMQVNVATRTVPIETSEPSFNEQCRKGMELDPAATAVHRLRSSDFAQSNLRITLVDPERVQRGGRNNAISRPPRDGNALVDAAASNSERGVVVLSEILFDKKHERAIVSYRYECGEQCGHGETIVLNKTKSGWKRSGGCDSWMN